MEAHDPEITRLLEQVMDESTVGDPMSPLKWNSRSTYQIQQYLASHGHPVSEDTVQRRLRELDYSLQANRKTKRGSRTPTAIGSFATSTGRRSGF